MHGWQLVLPAGRVPPWADLHSIRALDAGGGGGGGGSGSTASARSEAARARKQRKKEEQLVTTDSVKDYRGHIQDVDTLISYIECGDQKPAGGGGGSARRSERTSRRELKTRRAADEKDRRAGRRAHTKPATVPARSASLEGRPAAPATPDAGDHSSVCGDLAQPRAAAAAAAAAATTLRDGDGKVYVNGVTQNGAEDGFAQDFYSVAADAPAAEEPEFLVVTRRQRRRREPGSASSAAAVYAAAGARSSLPSASLRRRAYNSAPQSDGAASESDGEAATSASSAKTQDAAQNATSQHCAEASTTGGGSSWADVARLKAAKPVTMVRHDASTSTDFIDGVGAIFGEGARAMGRGEAVCDNATNNRHSDNSVLIGGAHPDEFPEISPTKQTDDAFPALKPLSPSAAAFNHITATHKPPATAAPSKQAPVSPSKQTPPTPPKQTVVVQKPAASPASKEAAPTASTTSKPNVDAIGSVSNQTDEDASKRHVSSSESTSETMSSDADSVTHSGSGGDTVNSSRAGAAAAAAGAGKAVSARTLKDKAAADKPEKLSNGVGVAAPEPDVKVAPAVRRGARRSPAVVISTEPAAEQRTSVADIQFGYIESVGAPDKACDAVVSADAKSSASGVKAAAIAKPLPPGVDGFCRRFRPQPIDVSQFNWREISVFLAKVYAEAVAVPGALFEEQGRLSCEARR